MAGQAGEDTLQIGQPAREEWDDLSVADRIAQAVRCVPGVCRMSGGRFALIATYGPGGRVPGVVLRKEMPDRLFIEVHVVVSETLLLAALQQRQTEASAPHPVLLQLAERIRLAVQQVVAELNRFPQAIDVAIEDTG